jgi:hypothetical protein
MANPIKGENNILYIYEGTAYKPIACLTSNSISNAVSIIESQTKCFPGEIKKQAGTISPSIDFEGEFIDTTSVGGDTAKASFDTLLGIQNARTVFKWKIDTDVPNTTTSYKMYGFGVLTDLSLDAAAGDELQTFSGTIDVSGKILSAEPV